MGERRGRRPGTSQTRSAIEQAARRQFAELGYDRTSMRQVAIEAGVDPALVSHYFGSKHELFAVVAELPFEPRQVLPTLIAGDRANAGLRLATFALNVLESEEGQRRITSIVRAATAEPDAARMIRELLTREVLVPLAEQIGSERARYRGSLLMSQFVGLVMARYIVRIEPLASMDAEQLARDLAPVLQHYLADDL